MPSEPSIMHPFSLINSLSVAPSSEDMSSLISDQVEGASATVPRLFLRFCCNRESYISSHTETANAWHVSEVDSLMNPGLSQVPGMNIPHIYIQWAGH